MVLNAMRDLSMGAYSAVILEATEILKAEPGKRLDDALREAREKVEGKP